MPPKYHIRPASSAFEDGAKILAFTDSQLPYLAQIGSAEQWGSASVSVRDAAQQKYARLVEKSEQDQTFGTYWIRIFVLEVEASNENVPIAAMILEGRSSDYARSVLPEQDAQNPFIYVRYLVTHRGVGELSKGSGRKLLDYADNVARSMGIGRLCLDGWNGNGYLLIKYYEKLGFVRLGDVIDEPDWSATVMERRVEHKEV